MRASTLRMGRSVGCIWGRGGWLAHSAYTTHTSHTHENRYVLSRFRSFFPNFRRTSDTEMGSVLRVLCVFIVEIVMCGMCALHVICDYNVVIRMLWTANFQQYSLHTIEYVLTLCDSICDPRPRASSAAVASSSYNTSMTTAHSYDSRLAALIWFEDFTY